MRTAAGGGVEVLRPLVDAGPGGQVDQGSSRPAPGCPARTSAARARHDVVPQQQLRQLGDLVVGFRDRAVLAYGAPAPAAAARQGSGCRLLRPIAAWSYISSRSVTHADPMPRPTVRCPDLAVSHGALARAVDAENGDGEGGLPRSSSPGGGGRPPRDSGELADHGLRGPRVNSRRSLESKAWGGPMVTWFHSGTGKPPWSSGNARSGPQRKSGQRGEPPGTPPPGALRRS